MAHLLRLELKKIRLRNYIFLVLAAVLFSMFFITVALHDSSESGHTFPEAFRVVEMIFAFVFVIFFSVLNSQIIISEYNNKTILLLFTYPVDRKKVILAKLILITLFEALSMLLGYLVCGIFIVTMDYQFDWVAGTFQLSMLYDWLGRALSTTVIFCSLGLWTFTAGMWKKSVPVTIVSSVLFIYVRQIAVASTPTYQENIWMILAAVAIALAGMWYSFERKITQLD